MRLPNEDMRRQLADTALRKAREVKDGVVETARMLTDDDELLVIEANIPSAIIVGTAAVAVIACTSILCYKALSGRGRGRPRG